MARSIGTVNVAGGKTNRLLGAMLGVIMQTPAQSVHTLMLRYRTDILLV